jgi:NAD(P)H-dependent flavin oxidoreductase YrpB (nitropropane dioxygenase family)
MNKQKGFRIGNLEINLPVVQGGMGVGISLAGLASAVANEGGIGVVSSVGLGMLERYGGKGFSAANLEGLRQELRKARSLSSGVIGVNIMAALSDFGNLLKTALQERVDIIFVGAGLLLKQPKEVEISEIKKGASKIAPIVSSARAAAMIFSYWDRYYGHIPDAVVVEGPLAGGHLGFKRTSLANPENALTNIVKEVKRLLQDFEAKYKQKIPLIAGGGIHSGEDVSQVLAAGADAVQMGTRFVATEECDASDEFKASYINSKEEDIVIIDSPVGLPGRALNCEYLQEVQKGAKKPIDCRWKCLRNCDYKTAPYCIARALTNAQQGHLKEGFAFCGANAYKIKGLMKVKELFASLLSELETAKQKLQFESIDQ